MRTAPAAGGAAAGKGWSNATNDRCGWRGGDALGAVCPSFAADAMMESRPRTGATMASIVREFNLAAAADFVWAAIRDIGAPHQRLARGFVTATTLEPGARTVTFGNGLAARELIVDIDDERRRFAYSIVAGRATHHNASFQVLAAGERTCRVLWVTDVLPDDLREPFGRMIEAGIAAMKQTVEADFADARAK